MAVYELENVSVLNTTYALRDTRFTELNDKVSALQNGMVTVMDPADMVDTNAYYIYVGTTSGNYINGHWYHYTGGSWVDGGTVGGVTIDPFLNTAGAAADAKAAGDAVDEVAAAVTDLIADLKSGTQQNADLHLGFYIDENGYICQV